MLTGRENPPREALQRPVFSRAHREEVDTTE